MSEKKKNWKKKAAVGAVAAAASTGILVGAAFDSPMDLLDGPDAISINAQADDDGGVVTGDDDEEKSRRGSPVRRWIMGLPLGVRACVCVPLWCIGWGLLHLAGLLYQAALTPLGSTILSWVLAAAMTMGVFCLAAKAMFPDLPLKKLLRPRHFLLILGGMFLLGIADVLLPYYWADYPTVGKLLRLLASALLTGVGALSLWRIGRRLKKKEAIPLPASDRTDVEVQAMALADSVCPRPIYRPE